MSVFDSVIKLIKYAQGPATTGTLVESSNNGATNVTGYASVLVTTRVAAASSLGGLTFAASDDSGTNYYPLMAKQIGDASAPATSFALVASTNYMFAVLLPTGATNVRLGASSLTGTITYRITPSADPITWVQDQILNASLAVTQSGTWTVQPGNTANSTPWLMTQAAGVSGGATMTEIVAAGSNNATSLKASAGRVYGWYAYNAAASARYIKLYDKASSPAPGTDTPKWVIALPAGSAANMAFETGLDFPTGIAYAIVTGISNTDNTSVTANDVVFSLAYK